VLTEKSRTSSDKNNLTSNKNPRLKNKKVIILINGGTASAAEILAGALKYNNSNIKVIGTRSYGKGTVQETLALDNGGALKITTEYWLLPNGKKLDNQNPISPDQELAQDQEKFREGVDNILEEALNQIKK
jgi:carboxyl-terminal processing protease